MTTNTLYVGKDNMPIGKIYGLIGALKEQCIDYKITQTETQLIINWGDV